MFSFFLYYKCRYNFEGLLLRLYFNFQWQERERERKMLEYIPSEKHLNVIPYLKGWFSKRIDRDTPLFGQNVDFALREKENSSLPPSRYWESSRIEEMRSDCNALKKENGTSSRPLSAEIKRQSKVCGDKLLRIAVTIIFFERK